MCSQNSPATLFWRPKWNDRLASKCCSRGCSITLVATNLPLLPFFLTLPSLLPWTISVIVFILVLLGVFHLAGLNLANTVGSTFNNKNVVRPSLLGIKSFANIQVVLPTTVKFTWMWCVWLLYLWQLAYFVAVKINAGGFTGLQITVLIHVNS